MVGIVGVEGAMSSLEVCLAYSAESTAHLEWNMALLEVDEAKPGVGTAQFVMGTTKPVVGMRKLVGGMVKLLVGMIRPAVGTASLVVGKAHPAVGMAKRPSDCCCCYCLWRRRSEPLQRAAGWSRS